MDKAYQSFIYNSQALWFNVIGDGVSKDNNNFVAPKGALVDCARKSLTDYFRKQGDYEINLHDWGFGFTAAGILLQSELMLIRRDTAEIKYYLPLLESSAEFVDSRRDTIKNIFLIGTAGNLLAPSYAGSGVKKENGMYEMAYLAEISINYIAALDRLIELEKMVKHDDKVIMYSDRREKIKKGLTCFKTKEGYFIRSIDKDGEKHGEYGAAKHGYFEATPNHDAIAFRIADDEQAEQIYKKMQSIPQLRPYKLILSNYPSYDDMYDSVHLFSFGDWVNGGHWTTTEARMQMGYYRVNAFRDAKEAFEVMLNRAYQFRLDNPLKDFGAKEYQPEIPVNCVYDSWGAPGGFLRGLFEYVYKADELILYPHIPPGIDKLTQKFPVFFGKQKIYVSTHGSGKITAVSINNKAVKDFTARFISLKPGNSKGDIYISIGMEDEAPLPSILSSKKSGHFTMPADQSFWDMNTLREKGDTIQTPKDKIHSLKHVANFFMLMQAKNLDDTYEAKHAELILKTMQAIYDRRQLKKQKSLALLIARSQVAADQLYIDAVLNETAGLMEHLEQCRLSGNQKEKEIAELWEKCN
jgi:hypothetical protein